MNKINSLSYSYHLMLVLLISVQVVGIEIFKRKLSTAPLTPVRKFSGAWIPSPNQYHLLSTFRVMDHQNLLLKLP